jgi:hypothetical protein
MGHPIQSTAAPDPIDDGAFNRLDGGSLGRGRRRREAERAGAGVSTWRHHVGKIEEANRDHEVVEALPQDSGGVTTRQRRRHHRDQRREQPAMRENRRPRSAICDSHGIEKNNPNPKNWLCISCYEYHLYSSEGQGTEYIHVQEGENIQRTP